MKILFITQLLPYPKDAGGKIIIYEILKLLSKKHEIYFFSFITDKKNEKYKKDIAKFCKYIYIEYRPIIFRLNPFKLLFTSIKSIFLQKPFLLHKYYSDVYKQMSENLISKEKFQVLFINHDSMFQYVPSWYKGKIVYNSVDISSDLYKQYAKLEINLFRKIFYLIESEKIKKFEKKIYAKSNLIYSISTDDKENIINLGIPVNKITFLPIPLKTIYSYSKNNSPKILFMGLLTWKPNEDGIRWFLDEIYPLILKQEPRSVLNIAGSGGKNLLRFKQKYHNSIRFIPQIKQNDKISANLYRINSVFIVPIRVGSGIRVKVLDALAHGIPVVSTIVGIQGLIHKRESGVQIANNTESFAQAVCNILQNQKLAINLSKRGFHYIKTNYSVEKTQQALQLLKI